MAKGKIIGFIVIATLMLWGGNKVNDLLDARARENSARELDETHAGAAAARARISIEDVVPGRGTEAKNGDLLSVHYRGEFTDGKKFDSSYNRGEPFEFRLGAGDVIQGWDLGLLGMKTGGKRVLVIPPDLAYGDRQNGPIPPSSTLKFTVELLAINGTTSTQK